MTPPASRDPESGVVLINVLSILALASAVTVAILTLQDVAIERSTRFIDASSATAYALGGESSAVSSLRRDALNAPETDHYGEPWALIQEEGAAIEGGRFALSIEDEQAKFNLNNLLTDGLGAREILRALLVSVKASPELVPAISDYVTTNGGLDHLNELSNAGVDSSVIARLAEIACVLPTATEININTVAEPLLAVMLGNRASARLLVSRRERQGFLTAADLALARVLLPARAGFRSDYYAVSITVTVGTVSQAMTSHVFRTKRDGQVAAGVWRRERKTAARSLEPPLQN
jgi:general secretion pathway protein K